MTVLVTDLSFGTESCVLVIAQLWCAKPWSEEQAEEPALDSLKHTPKICWGPRYHVLCWEKVGV